MVSRSVNPFLHNSTPLTSSSALDADDSQTTAKAKKLLTRDKKSARSLAILSNYLNDC